MILLLQILKHFLLLLQLLILRLLVTLLHGFISDYESLWAGTYSITIYCGYSLDFIIGYFKVFSNVIFNFDSYGVSIDFSDDNSKTFDDGGFNSFEDGVAEL